LNQFGLFLINLDRSPDRLAATKDLFNKINLNLHRVAAIDGSIEDLSAYPIDLKQFKLRHGRQSVRVGEVGCYFSHLKAIKEFIESQCEFGIILEDDTQPDVALPKVLKTLSEWKDQWDIIPLFHFHKGTPVGIHKNNEISLTIHLSHISSAAAYVINRVAAAALIKHLEVMRACIDHSLFETWRHRLKLRGVLPMPISLTKQAYQSTINTTSGGKPRLISRLPTLAHRSYVAIRIFLSGMRQVLGYFFSNRYRNATKI
jgi:glycosyl transferase family 25